MQVQVWGFCFPLFYVHVFAPSQHVYLFLCLRLRLRIFASSQLVFLSQVSEEYAAALSEKLQALQTEVAALREDAQTSQAKIQELEVAKRQGDVFQG